jgi:hypothetical protein
MDGKMFFVGDAVAELRPCTTAGTTQARLHILFLKKVFEKDSAMDTGEWEKKILG